jgi:hypothetical protein
MESTDTSAAPASGSSVPPGINPAFAEPGEQKEAGTEQKVEKAAIAAMKKLKIKGRDIEVDDGKYHEYAQKGAAATETWQEAAKIKKEAEAFMQRLKENPRAALSDPNLGIDVRKFAEEYLWEQLQDEQMSPEQKAARAKERRLEILEAEKNARDKTEQERQQMAEHEHYRNDYDTKISKALAASGLPKTTGTVRRVVEYMRQDIQEGIDRDPADYIDIVRQDYIDDIKELMGKVDGKTLIKMFGEETAKKMRMADLERLKSSTPKEGQTFIPGKGSPAQAKPKKLSGKDWERDVMKSMMGR